MTPLLHLPAPRLCSCGIVHRSLAPSASELRPYYNLLVAATSKDSMLDNLGSISGFGGLHTAYSTTGTNELTGGAPAYARVALTWAASSGGSKALAAVLPTWNIPASTTFGWWSGWSLSSAGVFRFMAPIGAGTLRQASVETAADMTAGDIFSKTHGYAANARVVCWGTLPTGLAVGTIYWVIATGLTADSFRVSTTQAGAAVALTGAQPFNFFVQLCVPQTSVSQDTYALSSASIDLSVVA